MEAPGYWFKSTLFEIEPGEDAEINPGIYGRQLAAWLKDRLERHGYAAELINEDWGRCLMCSREPFMLWVGCANMTAGMADDRSSQFGAPAPKQEEIVWHCFPVAEVFFWKRFIMRPDTGPAVAKLDATLRTILGNEPGITLVDEP